MASQVTCHVCNGSGICQGCDGTGSGKEANPHPDPDNIDDETGEVTCHECLGSGDCVQCDGTGYVDDDEDAED